MSLIALGQLSFLASVGVLGAMCTGCGVPLALAARGAAPLLAPGASTGH
jgi:hypothetical protein